MKAFDENPLLFLVQGQLLLKWLEQCGEPRGKKKCMPNEGSKGNKDKKIGKRWADAEAFDMKLSLQNRHSPTSVSEGLTWCDPRWIRQMGGQAEGKQKGPEIHADWVFMCFSGNLLFHGFYYLLGTSLSQTKSRNVNPRTFPPIKKCVCECVCVYIYIHFRNYR